MNQMELAVDLQGVGVQRGGRWILRNVNWRVPAGSCAAIVGPNGSGKSTLARIMACHLWPSAGTVSVLGGQFGDVDLMDLRRSVRLLQPAGPYDVDSVLTAHQVVLTGFFGTLALYDQPTGEMEDEAGGLLRQVGLAAIADHPYSTLSSGERLRCLIARALVQRPKLLLLDEPTAGLDLLAREQVLATVEALFHEDQPKTAVVMITHHIEELPPATSQVLVLSEGQVAACGAPQQVLTPQVLSGIYNCPVQVSQNNGRFYLQVDPSVWQTLISVTR